MQKPTQAQQRILNAMNEGAILIWEKDRQRLRVYGPRDLIMTLAGNQAFNMKRKGLIQEVTNNEAAIWYCRTKEAVKWGVDHSVGGSR